MRKIVLLATAAAFALSGCGSSSGARSEIAKSEELNLQANASPEKLIERYRSMHSMCRGDSNINITESEADKACDLRDKISERLKKENYCFLSSEQQWIDCSSPEFIAENDPFPYTAILTCSLNAFQNTGIPLMACMSSDYNSSALRVRNGDSLEVLKGWQIQNSDKYIFTERGLEIPLSRESSVKVTNYKDNLLLSMQVIDNDGNVLHKDVAERLDTIEFRTENSSDY